MEKQENIQKKKNVSKAVVLVPHNGKLHKNRRYGQGVVIALSRRIKKMNKYTYHVESEREDNKFYIVMFKQDDGPSSCTCPDYENHKDQVFLCKHMYALMMALVQNTIIDESEQKSKMLPRKLDYERDRYDF